MTRTATQALLAATVLVAVFVGGCRFEAAQVVECASDSDCPVAFRCFKVDEALSVCIADQSEDALLDTSGLDLPTPAPACGLAPLPCGTGATCCTTQRDDCAAGGESCACTDIHNDAQNCGCCGVICTSGRCLEGSCACAVGQDECVVGAGCVDLLSSPTSCGGCTVACDRAEACADGLCLCEGRLCDGTQGCCERQDGTTGCVDVESSPLQCGACGVVCGPGESCAGGRCVCGDTMGEVALGAACATTGDVCCQGACVPEGSPTCLCGSAVCSDSEQCCADVCVNVAVAVEHCGACAHSCPANQGCEEGACACAGSTPNWCGASCVDLASDATHCGDCATNCTSMPGVVGVSCVANRCGFAQCAPGYANCDGDASNGCEPMDGVICPGTSCQQILEDGWSVGSGTYTLERGAGAFHVTCDMDFDGGGWTLLGRIDQPSQWDVPSSGDLVHPTQGQQHWHARLGTMEIRAFRVLMSTSTDPTQDVKGHWSYQWSSPRVLTSIYEGACNRTTIIPDLVVNHHLGGSFAMDCMRTDDKGYNGGAPFFPTCWTQDCPTGPGRAGFAGDGSFSYDTDGYSGQDYTSGAFIGCDDESCCLCWGSSATTSYCDDGCNTTNGGQKSSSGRGWFWIR